ncbi:MAG: helix-turn-helix domain-containing protein [Verrucomicrobiota bacterium]
MDINDVLNKEVAKLFNTHSEKKLNELLQENKDLRQELKVLSKRLEALERQQSDPLPASDAAMPPAPGDVAPERAENVRITAKGIRSLRKRWGVSQAKFAKLLGVTPQTVVNWENDDGAIELRSKARKAYLSLRHLGAREAKKMLEKL